MKIGEISKIDEQGISDWLSGKAAEWFKNRSAAGELNRVSAAANKAQADTFYRNLGNALKDAETSGQVVQGTTPVPGKMLVKDFVKLYMDRGLRNYKIPPELNFDQNLATILDKFSREYRGSGNMPPSAKELWSAVQTVKSVADMPQVKSKNKQKKSNKTQATPATPAATSTPPATPAATSTPPATPAASSAPTIKLSQFERAYENMTRAERDQLKAALDIIDDRDRLASGTNESSRGKFVPYRAVI
jgi:hypothetical protein